ncbi:MAG: hypothetical protein AB1351_07385 [Thermoproteota archaeon]
MNEYELAILRVLLKSAVPVRKSKVIDGFPDDSIDFVLSAISDLKQANFIITTHDDSSDETLELAKEKRKEVLALVRPQETEDAKPGSSKGRGAIWITATLVIVGAIASVYVGYAAGVNDRIATQQSTQYAANDVKSFKLIQIQDSKRLGIISEPAFVKYVPRGYIVPTLPGDVLGEYYDSGETVPFSMHIKPLHSK